VFHAGEVTFRRCEIREILDSSRIPSRDVKGFGLGSLSTYARKLVILFALITGVSVWEPNGNFIVQKKRVSEVRDHYSSRVHSVEKVGCLADYFLPQDASKDLDGSVHLQSRIGNLEFLQTKRPLALKRIVKAIEVLPKDFAYNNFVLHSDSLNKAIDGLSNFILI
jgi:hypothetical protein